MVTYSVEVINAILIPVFQVPGRPTFCTLWQLSQELQECLGNMEHPNHLNEGYAGYRMTQASYVLHSTTLWTDPNNVGKYFIVPTTAITDTNQKSEERKLQVGKDLLDTFCNMRTALRHPFEWAVNPAYHSGGITNTVMSGRVFGNDKPPAILERLKILYSHQS